MKITIPMAAEAKSQKSRKPRRQSGIIPYRVKDGALQVLLISTTHAGKWGIPKGGVEPYLRKRDSAAKEAYEEAGLLGRLDKEKLGSYKYTKGSTGRKQEVAVFSMKVRKLKNSWDEDHRRERRWFHVDDARKVLPKKLLPMLAKLERRVKID